MKYSLAQLTVLNTSPVEIAQIAADCGYDYVSFRQIYMGLPGEPDYDLAKNKQLMAATKAVFADTGIKLLDVELARIYDDMDVYAYENALITAAELGGKYVLSSIWTKNRDYAINRFAELCDLAAKYKLTVALEYVPIAGVNTLAQTMEILDIAHRKNAGLMLDMYHFSRAKDRVEDLRKIPANRFTFAHLCDAPAAIPQDREALTAELRNSRLYVGEGGIDIAAILNAMPMMPYSIELPNSKRVAEYGYKEHARRCLETAKAYCNAKVIGRKQ